MWLASTWESPRRLHPWARVRSSSLDEKLSVMRGMVRRAVRTDPRILVAARKSVAGVARDAPRAAAILGVWLYVRDLVRYQREDGEVLVGPSALLDLQVGDCDDSAMLVASLLQALGIRWRFQIGRDPFGRAVHVWTAAVLDNGAVVPLDASTWSVPPGVDPMVWIAYRGLEPAEVV